MEACIRVKEANMQINVQVVIESEAGQTHVEKTASLTRGTSLAEPLGLSWAEAKNLLRRLQKNLAAQEIFEYLQEQRRCPHCGRGRSLKGHPALISHTVR
jgi:hypothetical protein